MGNILHVIITVFIIIIIVIITLITDKSKQTHGVGTVNKESELCSATSWDICDELSRLLYIAGSTLQTHTDTLISH